MVADIVNLEEAVPASSCSPCCSRLPSCLPLASGTPFAAAFAVNGAGRAVAHSCRYALDRRVARQAIPQPARIDRRYRNVRRTGDHVRALRSRTFWLYFLPLALLACVATLPADLNLTAYAILLIAALPGSVFVPVVGVFGGAIVFGDPSRNDLAVHLWALTVWLSVISVQGLLLALMVQKRRDESARSRSE